jgi:hypothetical protein
MVHFLPCNAALILKVAGRFKPFVPVVFANPWRPLSYFTGNWLSPPSAPRLLSGNLNSLESTPTFNIR